MRYRHQEYPKRVNGKRVLNAEEENAALMGAENPPESSPTPDAAPMAPAKNKGGRPRKAAS